MFFRQGLHRDLPSAISLLDRGGAALIARQRGEHADERRRFSRPAGRTGGRERVIAVVGAGASGTLAAVHLLRAGRARVVLIDPARPGLGVAYSTDDERHLLNVPAAAMGGLVEEPEDFLWWCRARGLRVDPADYLPRRLYGAYLQELLARFGERSRLRIVRARVENVLEPPSHSGVRMMLSDGRELTADAVVLALGNPPPAALEAVSPSCRASFVRDPWAPEALHGVRAARRVAILGSGLSAVDVALSITAANPAAEVSAISRHGWLPRAHLPGRPPAPRALALSAGCSLEQIVATVTRAAAAEPDAWRAVVDGLRPSTTALWQGLTPAERVRFERELRPYWEIHRHRLAPTSAERIRELSADGRLAVHSGGVGSVRAGVGGRVCVELSDGGRLDADVVVNATGPLRTVGACSNPLLRRLLASGRARPDELGVGIATSPDGALLDFQGAVSRRCFTLGPPRRGELLESTAIPEIRQQAAALARLLTGTSAQRERASSAISPNATSRFSGS
jgi:uncharacterized NAD(P)/FAD-binding protein YdhS